MKVLHLSIGKSYGGIESFIKTFVNNTNSIITNYICSREGATFTEELAKKGNENYFSLPFKKFSSVKDFKRVNKFCAENGIDIIQMHGVGASCLPLFCKKNKNIKYVYTVHGDTDFDRMERSKLERFAFRFLENRSMKKSDLVIAVSQDIKEKIIKRGILERKIEVIHNSIKCSDDMHLDINDSKKERRKFISIGRLELVKNYSELIKAFSKLPQDYSLDIYGVGDEMTNLSQQIDELGLSNRVRLMGFVENASRLIKNYDFYIQPSLYETFGLCLLESMQQSVPVLCSNVGGMKEIVSDSFNGFVIDGTDSDSISSKLLSVSDLDMTKILENAFDTVKKFSTDIMVKKYIECYEQITSIKDKH